MNNKLSWTQSITFVFFLGIAVYFLIQPSESPQTAAQIEQSKKDEDTTKPKYSTLPFVIEKVSLSDLYINNLKVAKVDVNITGGEKDDSAAIFAKACFGHPSPSKRQKSRGSQCLRRPQPSCFFRWAPNKGYPTSFSQ